jgi:uridine phosphorylase
MIPETNNQLVELQKKYDRLLQFHNNAMKMWRNENPVNTEMELAVLKTLLRDCTIDGADMANNTITVKLNTPNSVSGITLGQKAKILIKND